MITARHIAEDEDLPDPVVKDVLKKAIQAIIEVAPKDLEDGSIDDDCCDQLMDFVAWCRKRLERMQDAQNECERVADKLIFSGYGNVSWTPGGMME